MSVRRNTTNRLTLIRTCAICGKTFLTTADTPFVRGVCENGRQLTKYYCSESCKLASYKHRFDGKAKQRKRERDRNRDRSEWWAAYYAEHSEEIRERRKQRWYEMSDEERLQEGRFYRTKRKLLEAANGN